MTIYKGERIKEEAQGQAGLAICRDKSGDILTFLGGLVVPLKNRYEEFRIRGLTLVAAYDGIRSELAFELASKKEFYENGFRSSDLDKILLREPVEE